MVIGTAFGSVCDARGGLVVAVMPPVPLGSGVWIVTRAGRRVAAQVTAVAPARVTLAPFASLDGIGAGDRVTADPKALAVPVGMACLGRAIDAMGAPLDGGAPPAGPRNSGALDEGGPTSRAAVDRRFFCGVRALDGPLAFGAGARIGIFGAPGCGKSTLLETMVDGSTADVTVVALIGERGREAERWISRGDARTTIVCATSDRSSAERVRAAHVAFAQADALRRRGLHVLLVVDSLARIAAAARDLALAAGEPVGRGGYPPSVFALLAGLLERAGNFSTGSITLIATVLSEGADERDPVSDACRAALDGHVVLSERLARQGWFPAIDLPASASRTIGDILGPRELSGVRALRAAVAALDETREARSFGLDPGAGDPLVRRALAAEPAIAAFLRQTGVSEPSATLTEFEALTDMLTDGYFR